MDHLEPLRRRVRDASITAPPAPWKLVGGPGIGGLTELGFADDSELLLVLSGQGRGIFDCQTSKRVARDRNEDREHWYGKDNLTALGFGPLEGQSIRLAGLLGGGLPTFTSDGWSIESLPVDWPDESLLLLEPGRQIYREEDSFYKLAVRREVRAFGFSYSGKSLVLAMSSDLVIFGRE